MAIISTMGMYLFILAVIADSAIMWRGFKKELAARPQGFAARAAVVWHEPRHPNPPVPNAAPRVKRGEKKF